MAERLKITKVENVKVLGGGEISIVTLHLTAHHLILVQHVDHLLPNDLKDIHRPQTLTRESWFAYPMISTCTFRPTPQGSHIQSSIRLRGRDFRFLTLLFVDDVQAQDVFESIRGATCKLGRIEKLYAFSYEAPPIEKQIKGWDFYNEKAEWKRQGISDHGSNTGWRISKINTEYNFSPTYPALLLVPSSISDNTLNYAGRYRSRVRIPVLTYLHSGNSCSITRSSQPLAGLRGNRSIQDEKLVYACFAARQTKRIQSTVVTASTTTSFNRDPNILNAAAKNELTSTERLRENIISSSNPEISSEKSQIYLTQQANLIVDARPTVNAMAMQAVGLGSENMDHYKFASKVYLGIDNIHVMRESLGKVVEAIKDSDISKLPPNRERLAKSGWLKHITGLLEGSALIARKVGLQNTNVLIHCSDGWDRTSQLSALSQLLLDPYYRTIDGFIVLIEKDWLAFGHMFQHRSGFLSSEKWFTIQNDALAGSVIQPGAPGEGRGDAIENALLSAKKFFNKNSNSQDTNTDSEGEVAYMEDSACKTDEAAKEATKPKETSPVFHQFLDATYQLLYQYPDRFEFNERFLRRLLYHLYSCQYGTFLYNNEKSRLDARVRERTASVWDYFLSRRSEFTNRDYDQREKSDSSEEEDRLIFPQLDKVRWWHEVFNRSDTDMNGPVNQITEKCKQDRHNVSSNFSVAPEEIQQGIPAIMARKAPNPSSGGPFAGIREGIAGLGISIGKGSRYSDGKQLPEAEMR